jgi:hypothetical protein
MADNEIKITLEVADALKGAEKVIREAMAQAWDEGFDAGERDVFIHERDGYNTPCSIDNPYREADG